MRLGLRILDLPALRAGFSCTMNSRKEYGRVFFSVQYYPISSILVNCYTRGRMCCLTSETLFVLRGILELGDEQHKACAACSSTHDLLSRPQEACVAFRDVEGERPAHSIKGFRCTARSVCGYERRRFSIGVFRLTDVRLLPCDETISVSTCTPRTGRGSQSGWMLDCHASND